MDPDEGEKMYTCFCEGRRRFCPECNIRRLALLLTAFFLGQCLIAAGLGYAITRELRGEEPQLAETYPAPLPARAFIQAPTGQVYSISADDTSVLVVKRAEGRKPPRLWTLESNLSAEAEAP